MASLGPRLDARAVGLPLYGVRVLVAEDDAINCEIIGGYLSLQGAVTTIVGDGAQAISRLQAQPDAFDIVFMDAQMPVMDGFEATRRIRGELGLHALPIIALSAGVLRVEREACTRSGMDDFLPKPVAPDAVLATILKHVARNRRSPR